MNPVETALVSYLRDIKPRIMGFTELRTNEPDWVNVDIDLDASYDPFASQCIFDDCNDAQAKLFLESFLTNGLSVGWSVSVQLSKLLSTRGQLVRDTMNRLLTSTDWRCGSGKQLFLSYLAVHKDGTAWAIRLLDEVGEDFRDGLFLACFKLHSEELDRKLMRKFMEWDAGHWTPTSTGELRALEQFLPKWLRLYPYADLEGVIRLYFKRAVS